MTNATGRAMTTVKIGASAHEAVYWNSTMCGFVSSVSSVRIRTPPRSASASSARTQMSAPISARRTRTTGEARIAKPCDVCQARPFDRRARILQWHQAHDGIPALAI
jgi:hypothetical protein